MAKRRPITTKQPRRSSHPQSATIPKFLTISKAELLDLSLFFKQIALSFIDRQKAEWQQELATWPAYLANRRQLISSYAQTIFNITKQQRLPQLTWLPPHHSIAGFSLFSGLLENRPDIDVPKIAMPNLQLPRISGIKKLKPPQIDLPRLNLKPTLIKRSLPQWRFQLPKLPTLQLNQLSKKKKVRQGSGVIFKNNSLRNIQLPTVTLPPLRLSWKRSVSELTQFPWMTFGSLLLTVGILLSAYATYDILFRDLPSAQSLVDHQPIVSTKILDRNGNLLFSIYKDENRSLVKLSELPPHVVQATISIEDQSFYRHPGFSPRGIIRAVVANAQGRPIQGGSTITQQLVKNTLLTSERTYRRKLREVLLAVVVDATFTKDEILEMYFNEIPYGGATYGIEEASRRYFDKSARDLSLAEASYLAGLPAAPSIYSPFGQSPELGRARQAEVLRRMVEDGYISEQQAEEAKTQQLAFRQDSIDIVAPHFVMYVRDLLTEKYGEDILTSEGLIVRTTLDLNTQTTAQHAVTSEVDKIGRLNVSNGAALVTNPRTGEILAMVGSVDYFDFAHDGQVNVTTRPRQPGSSIKPLTYATAMEMGIITPSSVIDDSPVIYNIPGSSPYRPQNYDGKYHGRVTIRQSLASSYNIPAVKVLEKVGVNTLINKAEQLGISTWTERNRFGLSLTLGGGEVLMTDMAQMYSSFANYGYPVELNPLLEVTDASGKVLYRNDCALQTDNCFGERKLDPRVAYQITDILKDNQARTPAFGPNSVLHIPGQEVSVKTGTTNSLRDNWTIGYTTNRLVVTWVGNNDNRSMSYVASGVTGASPIWNNIIKTQLSSTLPHQFAAPPGMVKVAVCKPTGTLACNGCPVITEEYFIPGTQPTRVCTPDWFKPKGTPSPQKDQASDRAGL